MVIGIKNKKKGISLMISYVLLISIVIALSIGVFAWMKVIIKDVEPSVDCKEGTSIILEDKECSGEGIGMANLRLNLKNNGKFSIDGVIVAVSEDVDKAPVIYLLPTDSPAETSAGISYFTDGLKPGEVKSVEFLNRGIGKADIIENVRVIQIQPFIKPKGEKIVCKDAIIRQNIEGCVIG